MAAPDWFADCSALVVRHICRIASVATLGVASGFFWYAARIEAKTEAMQSTLTQIERSVDILIDRQPTRPTLPGSVARTD